MKRALLIAALALGLGACRHGHEDNKLIDGVPANMSATVVPVQAVQQYLFLKRDLLTVTIPVINKLVNADSTFPEVTSVGGGSYQFHTTDGHYGAATFTIVFKDVNGTVIDPIAVRASSTTVKSMAVTVVGGSALFSFSEDLLLQLDTSGVLDSTRRLSGTSTFKGINDASTYNLTFTLPTSIAIFEGIFSGEATATGAGGTPSQPTNLTVDFASNRDADGNVQWEGQQGTYHVSITGPAFVVTGTNRLFID